MEEIQYIKPLTDAFGRMKATLITPFDAKKWFVLGLTAWLAQLCERGGGGNFGNFPKIFDDRSLSGLEGAREHLVIILVIAALVLVVALVVGLVAFWINSRGKFMFLDNVACNRALIRQPWSEFKDQGRSLFLWRLVFGVVVFLAIVLCLLPALLLAIPSIKEHEFLPLTLAGIMLSGVLFVPLMILLAYVKLFLMDFVVAIMYRYRCGANEAWRRFLPLLRKRVGAFLLYGLFRFGVGIVVGLAVLMVVVITCCIAGCLLIIPYIGSVVLLPVTVTIRALSLEFLAQFSPDLNVFPPPQPPQPAAEPSLAAAWPPGPPPA